MKLRIALLSLFTIILLLPVGLVSASESAVPQQVQLLSRIEEEESDLEVAGEYDDDEHADDEHSDDGHADDSEDGHAHDDHHAPQPFTWRTLVPLFAGIVGAIIAGAVAKRLWVGVGTLDLGIIGLTALTGVLHLVIGLTGDKLLLLNGAGYLALLVLVYLPDVSASLHKLRIPLRLVLALYTVVTIVGYFWLHSPAQYDVLAILSKVVEVLLLLLVIGSVVKGSKTA